MRRLVLQIALAVGLAGLCAHALHGTFDFGGGRLDSVFSDWVYNGLMVGAALVCLGRAVAVRESRLGWLAVGLSLGAWTAGDVSWTVLYGDDAAPPYPSLSDAFYLSYYPLMYLGIVILLRERIRGVGASVWLDGIVAASAAAAIGAAVLFQVVLDATGGTTAEVATNLAYPLGDILLFSLVAASFVVCGWRLDWRLAVIGASVVLNAIADGIYLFQAAGGAYLEGTLLDSLWPAAMLLIAVAAWLPARTLHSVDLEGRGLLFVPIVCGRVATAVLTWDHVVRLNDFAIALAVVALLGTLARLALTFRENRQILERNREHARTDELTELGNRRRLMADLADALRVPARPHVLVLFDLDGFKHYNDTYGHPAGDELLRRLGSELGRTVAAGGHAYRLGGDEFCVLAGGAERDAERLIDTAVAALSERNEAFHVRPSFGAAFLPDEAVTPSAALHLCDQRLYVQKRQRRLERGRQPEDVLLRALYEREPLLHERAKRVSALASAVGRRLGLEGTDLARLARAAELHDIGKLAIPDAILHKRGELDESELRFVRNHTTIGERILSASPALAPVGAIVRASHERWDGSGYPDGRSSEDIPLAARIVAVCDAYTAMTSDRPHLPATRPADALTELRAAAGTQFDPAVVEAFAALPEEVRAGHEPAVPATDPAATRAAA